MAELMQQRRRTADGCSCDQRKLRDALNEKLAGRGLRLRPAIWKDLVNSKNVKLVLDGKSSLERLVEIYLDKEETYYPQPRAGREVLHVYEDTHARARALSELCARLLYGYCGVDAFRLQARLAGRLLSAAQVPQWIEEQARAEGPVAGRYATVPAPAGIPAAWSWSRDRRRYAEWLAGRARDIAEDQSSELPGASLQEPLVLEFASAPQVPDRIEIRGDGLLAALKEVVSGRKGLCGFTGWSEHAAVTFVLSGEVPPYRTATVAVRRGVYAAAAQIELQVSANMSVKEVAELYQEVRAGLRGDFERHMDDKHLALAVFIDEIGGRGWAGRRCTTLERALPGLALQDRRRSALTALCLRGAPYLVASHRRSLARSARSAHLGAVSGAVAGCAACRRGADVCSDGVSKGALQCPEVLTTLRFIDRLVDLAARSPRKRPAQRPIRGVGGQFCRTT